MTKTTFSSLPLLLLLLLAGLSCAKKTGPEETLTKFVNYRFSSGQTKQGLLDMASGKIKQSLQSMSDEQFEKFANMPIKKKRFKIIKTQCSPDECSITYLIKYDLQGGKKRLSSVESKKIALLENVEGAWFIKDVNNVKEFHKSDQVIDVLGN